MIDKSKDEIRAGMNPIERRILEREEGEARWRAYLKRRELLRQRPVEEVIEEAYEANEKVDRILARRNMLRKIIRRAQEQGIGSGNRLYDMCVNDKCFAEYPELGLESCSYRSIVGWRKIK